MRAKFRIIGKGTKYKIQERGWFFWEDLGSLKECRHQDWLVWTPDIYSSVEEAEKAVEKIVKAKSSKWITIFEYDRKGEAL